MVLLFNTDKRTVVFDPYMFLALPVPQSKDIQVNVVVVDGTARRATFTLPRNGTICDLLSVLCNRFGLFDLTRLVRCCRC